MPRLQPSQSSLPLTIFARLSVLLLVNAVPAHSLQQSEGSHPVTTQKAMDGFLLTVHVTAIHMEQGQEGVSGGGSTDANGNYSSHVSGGESYTWHLYTVQVEGDKKTYELSTRSMTYKGGTGLAVATMGWSAIATGRRSFSPPIGDYHGRWNKDGTLELQFTNAKGKQAHQTFKVESAKITPVDEPATVSVESAKAMATLTIESNVAGADIEIDGVFVGSTPSTLTVKPGQHTILVKRKGYLDWSRAMNVSGAGVRLSADLEPKP